MLFFFLVDTNLPSFLLKKKGEKTINHSSSNPDYDLIMYHTHMNTGKKPGHPVSSTVSSNLI